MKAKQKAEYLYNQMYNQKQIGPEAAKQCALIAVDEILDLKHIVTLRRNMHEMELDFWDEVKEEIKAL
jgi:hypothetical protein